VIQGSVTIGRALNKNVIAVGLVLVLPKSALFLDADFTKGCKFPNNLLDSTLRHGGILG
jgi:hypothetical protein